MGRGDTKRGLYISMHMPQSNISRGRGSKQTSISWDKWNKIKCFKKKYPNARGIVCICVHQQMACRLQHTRLPFLLAMAYNCFIDAISMLTLLPKPHQNINRTSSSTIPPLRPSKGTYFWAKLQTLRVACLALYRWWCKETCVPTASGPIHAAGTNGQLRLMSMWVGLDSP